jgi:hypothetical protein
MKIFTDTGRLIIPLAQKKPHVAVNEDKVKYVVTEVYCPGGCELIDRENMINGYPGIRLKFKRPGSEGIFILSAIEGDFEKIILSGELKDGVKDDLFCPHCGIMLEKLINCGCQPDADMVVLGLTPRIDFNNAITFCNVTGCENGTFVKSGIVIRHARLKNWY